MSDSAIDTGHETTALSGQVIRLPKDPPPYALLVLGFSEKSSSDSAACGKRLQEAIPKQVDANVFQLPILEGVPRLVRGFVKRSIKKSVSDGLQSTFIPVFDHEAEWKRLTAFESADDAYILLTGFRDEFCSIPTARAAPTKSDSRFRNSKGRANRLMLHRKRP